ncbi:MAG: putative TetR family transcriptional regulator [Friedmanniella sp.]|nr:putative TetR family transcriptional regulator [Friedmanniella sp.]
MISSRPYRSELREQQAEHTRRLIAGAARTRFVEKGWSGTSVRSVASEAGVSEATVYAVYGSKAGLATSLIDGAELIADVDRTVAELRRHAGDPVAQLRSFVSFDRRLFEQGGDVLRIVAEARRQHPDLGSAYAEGRRRGEDARSAVFASWPHTVWRPGVDQQRALDVYAIIVSVESYDIAVHERGWDPAATEQWWHATLTTLLLADPSV